LLLIHERAGRRASPNRASINQHAYDVSNMGFGETTDAHVSEDDDGASEALDCVSA
jgi:hypothetical protein